jgi:hypothetical protein
MTEKKTESGAKGMSREKLWNRCMMCGRLIAYDAFLDGRAVNLCITPSSEFSDERYETYHVACEGPTPPPSASTNPAPPPISQDTSAHTRALHTPTET